MLWAYGIYVNYKYYPSTNQLRVNKRTYHNTVLRIIDPVREAPVFKTRNAYILFCIWCSKCIDNKYEITNLHNNDAYVGIILNNFMYENR